ncbi:MAG: pyruvate kinase [Candidatus Hydrogenedentes bacterium]|nr:pyruvate kinase [Candidatus Hydrogenedentota bacterium]
MRRTKIICTMGPSTEDISVIKSIVQAGMNIARLNLSHGTHDYHRKIYDNIKLVSQELKKFIGVMIDLQGPKIRTGLLEEHKPINLIKGNKIIISTEPIEGNSQKISTDYEYLPEDVKPGHKILISDGTLELKVIEKIGPKEIMCEIVRGGLLGERKGMNLPELPIRLPSLTEKDWDDLDFGISLGVDFIALSFVRSPEDVLMVKKRLSEKNSPAKVIAKIERPEALENLDKIINVADAILIARGDLAVETELEEVPIIQKMIIRKCNATSTPVITATQMLESMTEHPIPTRAEITDVANAVVDGTDAVMLSAETATGKNPITSVEIMSKIISRVESDITYSKNFFCPKTEKEISSPDSNSHLKTKLDNTALAIGKAINQVVNTLPIKAIACFTFSGYTAQAISNQRPHIPVFALTPNEYIAKQCSLLWGVQSIKIPEIKTIEEMLTVVEKTLLSQKYVERGDIVVIAAGYPLSTPCPTNLIKVHVI